MREIKIPQYEFALKMQEELIREGGIFAEYYGIKVYFISN